MQHPGFYIQELTTKRGRSQEQLADILGKPKSKLSSIITGKANITTERAIALGDVFGEDMDDEHIKYSPNRWLQLQNEYELQNIKKTDSTLIKLKANFPIRELTKRGRLDKGLKKAIDIENKLKEILGIPKEGDIYSILDQLAKYKKTNGVSYNENSIKLRLRLAKVEASKKNLGVYNKQGLEKLAEQLHELTLLGTKGVSEVEKQLRSLGVGFVMLKHFEKTRVDGATFRDNENKRPIIVLSFRYDRLNNFWFTLAHEIGHVLLHEKILKEEGSYIAEDNLDHDEKIETEANSFATNKLINPEVRQSIYNGPLTTLKIANISKVARVHPAIIVGRLQHEKIIDYYQLTRIANEKIEIPEGMWLK